MTLPVETPAREALDISDPRAFLHGHPHDRYDRLRREDPVHHVAAPLGGEPYWLLTRYDDVRAISLDTENWTSSAGFRIAEAGRAAMIEPDVARAVRQNMLLADPPRHSAFRKPLVSSFTARSLGVIELAMNEAVETLLQGMRGKDEVEFVDAFSGNLPIQALCLLLGIPQADRQQIFDWTNKLVGVADPEYGVSAAESSAIHRQVFAYGRELIERRRAEGGEDVLSIIGRMEIDGRPIGGDDLDGMIALLLAAGNETTRNSLTGAVIALSRFPEQRRRLAAEPELMTGAVEELLRFVTPVMQMTRAAKRDIAVGTRTVRAGERVVLLYGAANRDPEVFDDPHALRLDRANARAHLAFRIGSHHCLGAHMARLQLRIALRALLREFPALEVVGEPDYLQSNFVSSVKRVTVALNRGRQ